VTVGAIDPRAARANWDGKLAAGTPLADARRMVAQAFRGAGLDTPELDARVLVGHALGLDHAALAAAAYRPLSHADAARLVDFAARRLAREPVARIVGFKEFWGLEIRLGAATLVPRPETETVVEMALALIDAEGSRRRPLRLADLGTGSGALLLALLSELPNAFGVATDISSGALAVAHDNAARLGLAGRAAFVACDFGAALAGRFDLVVSNPPYIKRSDMTALAPEVREHDPPAALDGGPDGLASYRTLARDASRLLIPRGHLVVELAAGSAHDIAAFFSQAGMVAASTRADLAGVARALHIHHAE
jgi:release factor glutamine methyltransferase